MKKIILIILIVILFPILNACSKKDVSDLSTVTALGLDKGENGFILTAQVMNAFAMGPNPKDVSPVYTVSTEAETVQQGIRKLTTIIQSRLFFYHFKILLIGEELAKEGIEPYINFFAINNEAQHDFHIVIVEGDTAENMLKIRTIGSYVPMLAIMGKINTSADLYGTAKRTQMDGLVGYLRSDIVAFPLSSLKIVGDIEDGSKGDNVKHVDPAAYIQTSNMAIFKEDKLIDWLTERESLGYNHIVNRIKQTFYSITKEDGSKVSVETNNLKTKLSAKISNGKAIIVVDVTCIAMVAEDHSGATEITIEYMNDIQERTNYEIRKLIEETIIRAQELNCDFFNFHNTLYRRHLNYYKTIKDNYYEVFPEFEYEINVKTTISRVKPGMDR